MKRLVLSLLSTFALLSGYLPVQPVLGAVSNWTQTTLDDFNGGTFSRTKAVIWNVNGAPDDGDVILDSYTLDQENWGPSKAPATPKIYGDNYEAQTFRASRNGNYITISIYLSKYGSPGDAIVELHDCTTNDPATAQPGNNILGTSIIPASQVSEAGNACDVGIQPSESISSGAMYAIVVWQNGGSSTDYYKCWYDGDYPNGEGWKQSSNSSGWEGGGFGGHDVTFRIYVGNETDGKGFYPSGNFTSSVKDIGTSAVFGTISWNATEPAGTSLKFQIATSADNSIWNFAGPNGTPGTFYETSGTAIWSGQTGQQYIRYKAYLETGSVNQTPVLNDVTITYDTYTPIVSTLTLSPKSATNVLPGETSHTFTATITDQYGSGIANQTISLSATFGNLTAAQVMTGTDGSATFNITSSVPGSANITAVSGNLSDTATKVWTYTPIVSTLTLSPKSATNVLPGETSHTFTATITDQYGSGIANQTISLSATFGNLTAAQVMTGTDGSATFNITSSVPGSANITAVSGNLSDTATKVWTYTPIVSTLTLSPKSATNVLPGETSHTFTATITDQYGSGIANQTISLSATFGNLTAAQVMTGTDGSATFNITSSVPGSANITAVSGNLSDTATKVWTYTPIVSTLTLSPKSATNVLPGETSHTFTATITDQYGSGIANQTISLSATFGNLTAAQVMTGVNGSATFNITSSVPGSANITAVSGNLSDTATKVWTYTPIVSTLTLSPKSATNVLPGETSHTFTATITDQYGSGIANQTISLSATFGNLTAAQVMTGVNGSATFNITSSVPGSANITAVSGNLSDTATKVWTYTPIVSTLTLSPKSATNVLPGETSHTFTATITDQYGSGIANQTISLSATFGNLTAAQVMTGTDGSATFNITSSVPGSANITAVSGNLSDTATKVWTYTPIVSTLTLSPKSATNVLPGETSHTFTATITDQYGSGIANQTISLSATFGNLTAAQVMTGVNGSATFNITSSVPGSANITAVSGNLSDTATKVWTYTPIVSTLTLSPKSATNVLPGETSHTFTATITDQYGSGIANQTISLSATFGNLTAAQVMTGVNGSATFNITSSVPGSANITAVSGNLSDTATKVWTYTPIVSTLTLSPKSATNVLPGETSHTFTATITDQYGSGIANQTISLSATFGNLTAAQVMTGVNGSATFNITSSVPGSANITAVSGNLSDTATKVWTYTPIVSTLTLSPKSATNVLPGETSHTFTATITDQYGSGIVNQTISLSATFGNLTAAQVVTGINGSATFNITSSVPGSANITAVSGNLSDTATKVWTYTPIVSTLTLSPKSATNVLPGETSHTFTATITDQYGSGIANQTISLSATFGNLTAAQVVTGINGSATFNITSSVPGSANITAVSGNLSDTATKVWTYTPIVSTLTLSPKSATIYTGDSQSYTARAFDQYNQSLGDVTSNTSFSIQLGAGGNWLANVYTSQNIGSWTVTGNYSGKTDSATLAVIQHQDNGSEVSPVSGRLFVVDFLGKITTETMTYDGRLSNRLEARDPSNSHVLELQKNTLVTDAAGVVVNCLVIRQVEAPVLPDNVFLLGGAYDFGPSGVSFDKPISITLSYDPNLLPKLVEYINLAYYTNTTGWVRLEPESGIVAEVGRISAPVNHFTIFGVVVKPRVTEPAVPKEIPPVPANFELSNIKINASELKVWQPVTFYTRNGKNAVISVDITNTGGQEGIYAATLKVNGKDVASQEVKLAPGAKEQLTFSLIQNKPGLYKVEIGELTTTFLSSYWVNWLLIAIIVISSGVVVWIGYRYSRKKRIV